MTKASELRELHDEELENRLAEASQELFNLRFQHVTGQLDNYARLGQVRRDLARIKTLLREREIEAAEAEEAAEQAEVDEQARARRARVEASRRGVVAGVGSEASRTARRDEESNDG